MPGAPTNVSLMINHSLLMFTLTWDTFNVSENSNETLQFQVTCSIETDSDLSSAVSVLVNSTSLTRNLSSDLKEGAAFNCCVVAAGDEIESWIVCTESVISTGGNLVSITYALPLLAALVSLNCDSI